MPTLTQKNTSRIGRLVNRLGLFWQFVLLSLLVFMVMGYIVISAIRPAIRSFIATQQERDAVVFANRLANDLLTPEDLRWPADARAGEKLKKFSGGLQIPARFETIVFNRDGIVVYADAPELVGRIFSEDENIRKVLDARISIAEFDTVAELTAGHAEHLKERNIADFFEIYIPITFGADPAVAAVLNTYSRTGFISKSASDVSRAIGGRIIVALGILYAALAGIVWSASRTIARQRNELQTYATGLEKLVEQRTKEIEEVTKKQLEQAAELSRLKDEFVSIAAHELRTPVTSISWNIELVFKDPEVERLSEATRERLKEARAAGKRLANLVEDLLNVSRIEAGTLRMAYVPLEVGPVIEETVRNLEALAKEKKVLVKYDPKTVLGLPLVVGDVARLREVFANLLSNAIKYNVEEGEVEITASLHGHFIEIKFRDTGMGMSKEEQANLFTKFWRVHHEISGTGLGLWIVKQIVTKLHGEILVSSASGAGSVFTVRLVALRQGDKTSISPTQSSHA